MKKTSRILLLAASALAGLLPNSQAVTVELHSSNVGISDLVVDIDGTTIKITETWTSSDPGVLIFDDLVPGQDYLIIKCMINSTGSEWISVANELLDPLGQDEDATDPQPYPAFVPLDFSTSNDLDGLSFAQGSGIPRVSSQFGGLVVDEITDARDFLDFIAPGTHPDAGALGILQFGLRENFDTQQPFLLMQRPNKRSIVNGPDAGGTLLLLSLGSLAMFALRRKQ